MLTPARGSKFFEETFTSGLVFERVDGIASEPRQFDGNYVIASRYPRPWIKQLNMLIAYASFYNPFRLVWSLFVSKSHVPGAFRDTSPAGENDHHPRFKLFRRDVRRWLRVHFGDALFQMFGMVGLWHSARRLVPWCGHLVRGRIERTTRAPTARVPMRSVEGGAASHAIPGTPTAPAQTVPLRSERANGNARVAAAVVGSGEQTDTDSFHA